MPFDAALAGLTANGITKLIETDIGDKCIHHVANPTTQDGRSKDVEQEASSRSLNKECSKTPQNRDDDARWSRKSYWRSSRHQQQAMSEPRMRAREASKDEWSRKTYWKRSRHQQQPCKREERPVDPDQKMSTAAQKEERLMQQRRDKFREAKDSYVPAASCGTGELVWEADKLYAEIGRAVRSKTGEPAVWEREQHPGETLVSAHAKAAILPA